MSEFDESSELRWNRASETSLCFFNWETRKIDAVAKLGRNRTTWGTTQPRGVDISAAPVLPAADDLGKRSAETGELVGGLT